MSRPIFKLATCLLALLLIVMMFPAPKLSAEESDGSLTNLLPLVGGALVEAGAKNWEEASTELLQFETLWNGVQTPIPVDTAEEIKGHLDKAKEAIQLQNQEEANSSLSALAKTVNTYVEANTEKAETPSGKDAAQLLQGMAENTLSPLEQEQIDVSTAQSRYKEILNKWHKIEGPIRSGHFGVYSDVERHMSLIRISLQAEPPKTDQAISELKSMLSLLQNYIDGKLDDSAASSSLEAGGTSLADALILLRDANQAIQLQDVAGASSQMSEFITLWPSVEGEVSISSATIYTDTENKMTEAQSYLVSTPPDLTKAQELISKILNNLEPLAERTAYSAWDAALILLREGLEAILVLAALLAFVKRANNRTARSYVWAGAGTGLLLSGVLAAVLTYVFSQSTSGSTRELIEGFVGLLAVLMMLTVGHWLHSKSSTQAWNNYLSKHVGGALQRGSLWSLFALSGLAIIREGAETAVFYIGMAPSIEPMQFIIGITGALLALIILGFCIIRFSVKLPIRSFMLTATLLIYYLVIRFTGESIHSLQISGILPAHSKSWLPSVSWLGAFPTWETTAAQLALLLFVLVRLYVGREKSKPNTSSSNAIRGRS